MRRNLIAILATAAVIASCGGDKKATTPETVQPVVENAVAEQVVYENEYIVKVGDTAQSKGRIIDMDSLVSMNMWGFTPEYFDYSYEAFKDFLKVNEKELKAEFYIPTMVDTLINDGRAKVKVLETSAKWFGVTYIEDKPNVLLQINDLISKGVYPNKLWCRFSRLCPNRLCRCPNRDVIQRRVGCL